MNALNLQDTKVNWRHVWAFVCLTFGLTWALDLLLWRTGGYGAGHTGLLLQLQMLIPAFCAILLGLFFFTESPFHISRPLKAQPRIFFYFFLAYTVAFAALALAATLQPGLLQTAGIVTLAMSVLGMVLFVILRITGGREAFEQAGLKGGKARHWLLYGLGFVLMYALLNGLDMLFRLGNPADVAALSAGTGMPPALFMAAAAVQTIVVGPFLGLLITFGEEFGWRGYLQSALTKMGKKRGILVLGLVWSVWHWPIIWMGHNYPGQPVLGTFLMTAYTTALAFILGYAVLKTGSVWLATYLHALNNQTASFFMGLVYMPVNIVLAFQMGVYGMVVLWVIVALLLRDPVWRDDPLEVEPLPEALPEQA